ncbi:MAG: hypothetical protein VX430_07380 [Pseudomonadota bacterium]|nr:hypothetical protein [Pseudomonadota bacterium]
MVLPLGTSGAGGFSSAFSTVGLELFSLLPDAAAARGLSIAAAAQSRIDSEPIKPDRNIELAARQAKREAKDLSRIKSKLDTVNGIVKRARKKLDEIRLLLVDMRKAVELSQKSTATDEEKRTQANIFDQKLGLINIKVRNFGTIGNNLLGNQLRDVFEADTISFPIRPNSLQEDSITGLFAGSDFTITETSTSTIFVPDIFGAKVQSLPISINDDVDDGTQLLDDDTIVLNNATGAISITRNGEGSPVLEGTLERKGLKVLFSPFYSNFLNDSSLSEALADVDTATQTIRFITGIFDGFVGRVGARRNQIANLIKENEKFAQRVETENLRAQLLAQTEQQRNSLLFSGAVNSTFSFSDSGILTTAINNLIDIKI